MMPPVPIETVESRGVICACNMQDMASVPALKMVESKRLFLAELRDLIPNPETRSCERAPRCSRASLGVPANDMSVLIKLSCRYVFDNLQRGVVRPGAQLLFVMGCDV
jgi:hypothetical protein